MRGQIAVVKSVKENLDYVGMHGWDPARETQKLTIKSSTVL